MLLDCCWKLNVSENALLLETLCCWKLNVPENALLLETLCSWKRSAPLHMNTRNYGDRPHGCATLIGCSPHSCANTSPHSCATLRDAPTGLKRKLGKAIL
jgi:hypothetical protein